MVKARYHVPGEAVTEKPKSEKHAQNEEKQLVEQKGFVRSTNPWVCSTDACFQVFVFEPEALPVPTN